MIKTTNMLKDELKDYVNPMAKVKQLINSGELFRIVRGLYETDESVPGYYLAPIIYGPSYLSFEFALAYHSLIPEAVYTFTSATFEKKKVKRYETPYGTFVYRDIPKPVYPVGIVLHSENGYGFQMATPEKALCDMLYKVSPLGNRSDLENLMFNDLRIDMDRFADLNLHDLIYIASMFNTKNHKLLQSYIRMRMRNE